MGGGIMNPNDLPGNVVTWLANHPEINPNDFHALCVVEKNIKDELSACTFLIKSLQSADPKLTRILEIESLPRNAKKRLAEVLSLMKFGKIPANEITIRDLLESAYDLSEMPALNRSCTTPMFIPSVVDTIKYVLKKEYGIIYDQERKEFHEKHTGKYQLIARMGLSPKPKNSILEVLGNHEATLIDILKIKMNLRQLNGVGHGTVKTIKECFEEAGIDYKEPKYYPPA